MELKHLNEQEFQAALAGTQPAVIDFFATWCGPCKALGPTMETLAERYADRALVAKVDVDQQRALAMRYGVMSVPTVVFFKNGSEVGRKVGAYPLEEYTALLDSLL